MEQTKQYNKEIFVKDYFKIHNFYSTIYGKDKTIILMQVGSFHEAYCTNDDGLDLVTLSQKLDVVCTKKNGNKELSESNPRMMGFPIHVTHNFIEKLIHLNFVSGSEICCVVKYHKNEKYIIGFEDSMVGYTALKRHTDLIYIYDNERIFINNDCYLFDDYKTT
jgi:DNA mismatch repair ATPase MutS